EYTLDGLLCKEIKPNGLTITYSHDSFGSVIQKDTYDPCNNLLISSRSIYNTFHLIAEIDEEGIVTNYTYDFAGRLIKEEKLGKTIESLYDTFGRKTRTIESD